ncbi:hypothetical protein MJO29_006082 [Puccinia striiformis f. sp. tritici]|nr:hypothetical protein MJO29_006082 [Puccinia striiformis f. sp. tritici]
MLHQNRVIMIAFLISLLAISPISTLPSETTYPTLSAKATSRKSHSDSAQRPENGQLREQSTHQGDATYYSPGLGSCGQESGNSDLIVAISHTLYDSYAGANQDGNSLCGKSIRASYGANSIVVSVVDRCEGCSPDDLDLSPAAFRRLSPLNTGRLHGIRVRQ